MKAIRMRDIKKLVETGEPFDCRVYTSRGRAMDCAGVVCSSSYHGGTYNVVFPNGDVRKIKERFIVSINGMEVFV